MATLDTIGLDGLLGHNKVTEPNNDTSAHCDSYFYDDLLITTTRELITNGMQSKNVPKEIKNWIFSKIMDSLPEQLVRRLLNFVLENRNERQVAYKENSMGDEFTILVYKSERQLKTREKILVEEMEKRMGLDPTDYEKMFTETALDIQENGMDFHAPEIICDESTKIGYKDAIESVVAKQMRNLTHGTILRANEDSISDSDNGEKSDYEEIKKDLKRKVTRELEEVGVSSKKQFRGVKNFGTVSMKTTSTNPRFKPRGTIRDENKSKNLLGQENLRSRSEDPYRDNRIAKANRGKHVKTLQARLDIWNKAYENVREEKLEKFDSTEEQKLNDLNVLVKSALRKGLVNNGQQMILDKLSNRGKQKSVRIQIPYPEECPFCEKMYPYRTIYLHPHIRQEHKDEWPVYWNKNKPKSKRVLALENTKEFEGLWKYNEQSFDAKSNGQQYDCLVCGDRVNSANHMYDHLNRYHVKINTYNCEYCGESMADGNTLRCHIIYKHTQDFPFRCKFCGKGAVTYYHVLNHIRTNHKEYYAEEKASYEQEKKQIAMARQEARDLEREQKEIRRTKKALAKRRKLPREVLEQIDSD